MSSAPYFSVESDTLGTLRVSGAITFANAARALTQAPQMPRAEDPVNVDLAALENVDVAQPREIEQVLRRAQVAHPAAARSRPRAPGDRCL